MAHHQDELPSIALDDLDEVTGGVTTTTQPSTPPTTTAAGTCPCGCGMPAGTCRMGR